MQENIQNFADNHAHHKNSQKIAADFGKKLKINVFP